MSNFDNSKLKELMNIDPEDMTDKNMDEFFSELKNANLLVPVEFTNNHLSEMDNVEEGQVITLDAPIHFQIITIKKNNLNLLPLFTDSEALSDMGDINVIEFPVSGIVDFVIENDNIDEIVINPNTDSSIGINVKTFIIHCSGEDIKNAFDIEEDIKEYGVPFENDTLLYLRSETPFMFEESKEGLFSSDIPFGASTRDVCNVNFKFLNKLYIPKGTIFLYLSNIVEDITKEPDVFLAPNLKFHLINKDKNTFEWLCVEQDIK